MAPIKRKRPTVLYFDNSVLDPIAEQDVGGPIKALLRRRGTRAFASRQNLIEAWRIRDDNKRAQFVRTLMKVARDREEDPLQFQSVRAVVAQLRINHPDWLAASSDRAAIRGHRVRFWQEWEHVRADPKHICTYMADVEPFLQDGIRRSVGGQRIHRQLQLKGLTIPTSIIDPAIQARRAANRCTA